MSVIAELMREIPAAAKYHAELDRMARENERLRTENAELRKELEQYIEKWETLDGDAVRTLVILAQSTVRNPAEIAQPHAMNFQIVEMYLKFLVTHVYAHAPAADGNSGYGLTHKGRRYLLERGLLAA